MEKRTYYILATFLLLVFVLRFLDSLLNSSMQDFWWFCVMNLLLLVIGLYLRSNLLISSVATSMFLLELLWLGDITSFILTKKLLFGVAGYLFDARPFEFALTFYHLFLLIIPIYVVFKERKFHRLSWVFSSSFFFVVALLTLLLSSGNVNCVRDVCDIGIFSFIYALKPATIPYFIVTWLFNTLVIYIPTHYLFYFLVNRKKKE